MKSTLKRVPTSVRFTESVYNDILCAARRQHRSVSNWIEMAVMDALQGDKPEEEELTIEELNSIRRGLEEVKAGRTYAMQPGESLESFLARIEPCIK